MAANPLPLLLLAGGAFLMARSKSGSASGNGKESASPDTDTVEDDKGAPLFILGKNCQPVTPPEADRPAFQAAVAEYIAKRAPELYTQSKEGNPPVQRFNANLTPEQAQEAKALYPDLEVNFSNVTYPMEDIDDIWYSIYLELVPGECAKQTVWNSASQEFQKPLFPTPSAACVATLIQLETARVLKAVGVEDVVLTPEKISELLTACTGMDMALGGFGEG